MRKICALSVLISAITLQAQNRPAAAIEWPYVGAEQGQTKYSAAAQITPANVSGLKMAWQWEPKEAVRPDGVRPGNFQATPLMIDNVLYLSTSFNRVVALNAETGAELWVFDPQAYLDGPGVNLYYNHRGVSAWRDGNDMRIFMNSHDRMFSVDARTGQLVTSFGNNGYVNMREGLRNHTEKYEMRQTSPTVIFKNLVIVGSSMPDRVQHRGEMPGTVQAFDVRTGKRVWVFYTIPQPGEFGVETWENDSWSYTGHSNVWGPMSVDEARGLLYVPTSTPGNDYYGGRRHGANLFSESLLALDANTGKRKWHFQTGHHGLWDYDLVAPPNLLTLTVNGRRIDAVAEVSKQGFTYVFDRVTGAPIWPIEERPVDTTTDVPGEKVYPTQPFPTKPPPFAPQGVSLEDANDLTPEIKALATEELKKYRLGPLYTPPSLRGTQMRPGNNGGANWGGAAIDPETNMLYVRASTIPLPHKICAQKPRAFPRTDVEYNDQGLGECPPFDRSEQLGSIPLTKPPYGLLTALDFNRGTLAWQVPAGEGSAAVRNHPLLKGVALPERLGSETNAGPMVTKGGLVFATASEPFLYAYDKATGREVAQLPTPYRPGGNPMTYVARSGRQFVVVATGAGPDASLVAFALPGTNK